MFHYLPLLGNVIAFQDYQPYLGFTRVRLGRLHQLLVPVGRRPGLLARDWNTLFLAVLQRFFFFPIPLALALLLHSLRGEPQALVQSVVYLPHFLSWVIVVALFQQVLADTGLLNRSCAGRLPIRISSANPDAFKRLSSSGRSGRTPAGARSSSSPR